MVVHVSLNLVTSIRANLVHNHFFFLKKIELEKAYGYFLELNFRPRLTVNNSIHIW